MSVLERKPTAKSNLRSTEVIETPLCQLRLDARNGNLVGATWKSPRLEIIQEPRLGENFRLLLPKADYEASYFNSREQQVSRIERTADGVVCHYQSLKNSEEILPVSVAYSIRSVGDQVHFSIEVANPTDRKLAEVYYGILGGMQGVDDRLSTETLLPLWIYDVGGGTGEDQGPGLFVAFPRPYNLGIRYNSATYLYPGDMTMGWMDAYNRKANIGLYYANQDTETRLTALQVEVRPFTGGAPYTESLIDTWPAAADVPPDEPIGLTMGWVNFPYLNQGTFRSGPVALQVHLGDWHRGSEVYRRWFDQHFSLEHPPTWLRKEMAWQTVLLSNSEDVIVHQFKDLPKLAEDAKKYGVTTFQITGWNVGGWDRGYPQYQLDPRLGTLDEFRQALADIRRIGVHLVLFANIQVADTATPWFKNELNRYVVRGRWAEDQVITGFGQGTIACRAFKAGPARSLVCSGLTLVSPAHPEFRKVLMDQYLQLVREGVEGLELDKANAIDWLDFNPRLTVSPDKSLIGGVIETYKELLSEARKIHSNFALCSEILVDRTLPYIHVTYHLGPKDVAFRYTFPEWVSTIDAESPGDFDPINDGMRYGSVWHVGPMRYHDSLDAPLMRPLARYLSELIRIRTKYQNILFYGRFWNKVGAEVKADKDVRYSVFEGISEPGKACVVVNYGNQEESAEVTWPDGEG